MLTPQKAIFGLIIVAVLLLRPAYPVGTTEGLNSFINQEEQRRERRELKSQALKMEEGLKFARNRGNKHSQGILLSALGFIYTNLAEYEKAIFYFEEALEIRREIGDKEGMEGTLIGLAFVYHSLNEHEKAISYYEQALGTRRQIGDKEGVSGVLIILGHMYVSLGNYQKGIPYLEEALELKRELGDKTEIGVILGSLGAYCTNSKDYQKGIPYLEEALEIKREISDREGIVNVLELLGLTYTDLAEYERAISLHEENLTVKMEIGDEEGAGRTLAILGDLYTTLSDYQKALSSYERAAQIQREIGDKVGFGDTLTGVGDAHRHLGHYRKALSSYQQALKTFTEIGDKRGIANNLTTLGSHSLLMGDYSDAISYFEQALEIYRKMRNKPMIGVLLGYLGVAYYGRGQYHKALSYHEQALEIQKEIGHRHGIAMHLTNIANVYASLGDHRRSISCYTEALEIYTEIGDKGSIGNVLQNLGGVYENLGHYQKALLFYEEALKIKRDLGVPTIGAEVRIADIWLKKGEIEKAYKTYLAVGALRRLGRLSLVKGDYRKAIGYLSETLKLALETGDAAFLFADYVGLGQAYEGLRDYGRARQHYEDAIFLVEEQREALADRERSRFLATDVEGFGRIVPFEKMVSVLIGLGNREEAFLHSESLKARVLSEAIAHRQYHIEESLPAILGQEENAYVTKIRGLRRQMEALYKNKNMDAYYEQEKELGRVKEEQNEFIRHLRDEYPEYASISYPEPLRPSELRLYPEEVLIEFEVTDEATYVFLLKEGKLTTRKVPISREDLEKLIGEYRSFFVGVREVGELIRYRPEVGRTLYRVLLGNLLDSVLKKSSLIIVPDEILGILPFEALVTELPPLRKVGEGEHGPFPVGVKYLGDEYSLSYAYSATSLSLLRTLQERETSGGRVLVVASPIFSSSDPRLEEKTVAEMRKENLSLLGALADWKMMGEGKLRESQKEPSILVEELFPPLAKTEELAQEIESLFGSDALILLGLDAREDRLIETLLSSYRYFVFATHGILNHTIPWIEEPALVLSQVGNPEGYDGFLTMTEVMNLDLRAEVVVLTACETGLGENLSGEGVMGMGRAFQYAGAGNVLVSLWSVAEAPATEFTCTILKYLRQGEEPREAVRLARSHLRREGYEHPFYWAPFILVGR